MTKHLSLGRVSNAAAALLLILLGEEATAVCDDVRERPGKPNTPVVTVVGYKPQLPDFDSESDAKAFSEPYPAELVKRGQLGKLADDNTDAVSYWEPDSRGGLRVCRIEWWYWPSPDDTEFKKKHRAITRVYTAEAPGISRVVGNRKLAAVTLVYYDANDRIERVAKRDLDSPGFPIYDIGCRRYDTQHRLLMSIQPETHKKCPVGQPDPRDSWFEFRYGGPSEWGTPEILINKHHFGRKDGTWFEKWHPFAIGSSFKEPWGNADVDSVKGVMKIWGADFGHRDNNSGNTVLDSFGKDTGMNYEFTRPPVPVEVLQSADLIYRYERRRYTRLADGVRMNELFPPNSHLSRHRYYMMDGLMVRHEQLNADGTAKRVITLQNYVQPYPGPRPLIDDKKLSRKGRLLYKVFHRVYDIDRNGNPKLVAMSWSERKRYEQDGNMPVEFSHLVYGTPDGKERWKSKAAFEKAFDTSSAAVHVFPDYQPGGSRSRKDMAE